MAGVPNFAISPVTDEKILIPLNEGLPTAIFHNNGKEMAEPIIAPHNKPFIPKLKNITRTKPITSPMTLFQTWNSVYLNARRSALNIFIKTSKQELTKKNINPTQAREYTVDDILKGIKRRTTLLNKKILPTDTIRSLIIVTTNKSLCLLASYCGKYLAKDDENHAVVIIVKIITEDFTNM